MGEKYEPFMVIVAVYTTEQAAIDRIRDLELENLMTTAEHWIQNTYGARDRYRSLEIYLSHNDRETPYEIVEAELID